MSKQISFDLTTAFDKSRVVTGTVVLAAPAKVTVPVAGPRGWLGVCYN